MPQDRLTSPLQGDDPGDPRVVGARPGRPAPPAQDAPPCLLVGIDRHPSSHVVLETAAALAMRLRASLKVVHVVDLSDFPIDPDSFDWDAAAADALDEQRSAVTRDLALFGGPWTFHIQRGNPARVLADMADQSAALMVVIGTGRTGVLASLIRALEGSVAHSLSGHQRRPLLLVPSDCVSPADTAEEAHKK